MLPSAAGRAQIAEDPLTIIKVWDGGMASHGGILGLTIFAWFYARKHQLSWLALGDGLVCVAPLGIFFGRVANFINGELYGHVSQGLPWLVKFPGTIFNSRCEESAEYHSVMRVAIEASNGQVQQALQSAYQSGYGGEQALAMAIRASDSVKTAVEPFLLARHPSQLYEGLLEGLLLFLILTGLRLRFRQLPTGTLSGLFFLLYGIGRIYVEQFRVPDSALFFETVTKGQFYSFFFVAIGIVFLIVAKSKKLPEITS